MHAPFWSPKNLYVFLIFCFLIILGCSTNIDPTTTDGEKLPGTEDVSGNPSFTMSPDGHWIFYSYIFSNKPVFVLYDVMGQSRKEISLSPKAKEVIARKSPPLYGRGCWNPEGNRMYIPGAYSSLFFVDVESEYISLQVDTNPDEKENDYYFECSGLGYSKVRQGGLTHTFEKDRLRREQKVRIQEGPGREILLVDAKDPNRVLARHKDGILSDIIGINTISLSPDGRYLAYDMPINGVLGFSGPTPLYVLDLESDAKPVLLAATFYGPARWSPDGQWIYAWIDAGGVEEEKKGIYRWNTKEIFE